MDGAATPHTLVVEQLLRTLVPPDIASLIARGFNGGTHQCAEIVKEAIDHGLQSFPDNTVLEWNRCDLAV